MTQSVEINGTTYTLAPIKMGVGRRLKAKYPDPEDFNVAFVGASLQAGGLNGASYEWVDENIDYGKGFIELLTAALAVNGFKTESVASGEEKPPAPAA